MLGDMGDQVSYSYRQDVFSFGLTIFYVLAGGNHPFGKPIIRTSNILNGKVDWAPVSSLPFTAVCNLTEAMLSNDPFCRPTMSSVLEHPLFWDSRKNLEFLNKVSNFLAKAINSSDVQAIRLNQENSDAVGAIRDRLNQAVADGFDWKTLLCKSVQNYLASQETRRKNPRKYNGRFVVELIKFIRDKDQHYSEWPDELKQSDVFGEDGRNSDETYSKYFTDRFPHLVTFLFTNLQKEEMARKERKLTEFFSENETSYYKKIKISYP
jgi:serine/threonine-protein kinase/endoribonuclease IRE1